MSREVISSDDWSDWYFHPGTRAFIKVLEKAVVDEKLNRNFSTPETLAKDFFTSQGRCRGLEDTIKKIKSYKKES